MQCVLSNLHIKCEPHRAVAYTKCYACPRAPIFGWACERMLQCRHKGAHTHARTEREGGEGEGKGWGERAREREREREAHIHAHTQPLGKSNELWRPVGWGGGALRCFGDGALTRLGVDSALLVFLIANEAIILPINIACDMPTGGFGATGSCGASGTCRTAIPSGPPERIRSAAAIPSLRQDQRGEGKTCEKARSGEHACMHMHIPSQDAHMVFMHACKYVYRYANPYNARARACEPARK